MSSKIGIKLGLTSPTLDQRARDEARDRAIRVEALHLAECWLPPSESSAGVILMTAEALSEYLHRGGSDDALRSAMRLIPFSSGASKHLLECAAEYDEFLNPASSASQSQ